MDRQPSSARPSPAGRVTLTLHGPISELAAALRTLADALDREQATGAVTYAAAVEADELSSGPGRMTAALADRFVAQLSPAAVDVLALLCHNAPQLTYEDLQAQAQAPAAPRRPGYGAHPRWGPVVGLMLVVAGREAGDPVGNPAVVTVPAGM